MMRRFFKKGVLLALASLGVGYALYYSLWGQSIDPATGHGPAPTSARSATALAGSGLVEPRGRTIAVSSPLPGVVDWVIGEDRVGEEVQKGEVLLRLDARQQQAELKVRQTQLASERAMLARLKSQPREEDVAPARAKAREFEMALQDQTTLLERAKKLRQSKAMADEAYVRQYYAVEVAKARLDAARAELRQIEAGAWSADIKVSEMAVQRAEAQVEQIEADLDRLEVKSLSNATLLKVDVRPQEYVGAPPGTTLMLLGDTSVLHVRVDIDEQDASEFHAGLKGTAQLRGPDARTFPLEYVRTEPVIVPKRALTGEQTERMDVRVLQVIYRFKDREDQRHVYVGQQLDVYFVEP